MVGFKTNAIILKSRDVGEADRQYTMLTPGLGVVSMKAKGARRIKSKLAGHLDIFSEVTLDVVEGRANHVITGAKTLRRPARLRNSFAAYLSASNVAAMIIKMIKAEQAGEVYALVRGVLSEIDKDPEAGPHAATEFGFRLLAVSGFGPEFVRCVMCSREVYGQSKTYFSVEDGGVLCGEHKKGNLVLEDADRHRLLINYMAYHLDEAPIALTFIKDLP